MLTSILRSTRNALILGSLLAGIAATASAETDKKETAKKTWAVDTSHGTYSDTIPIEVPAFRAITPELWTQETAHLNVPFSTVNTTVLVLSSVTCQLGVFAAERGQVGRRGGVFQFSKWGLREWFVLTYLMGAFFIAGQVVEYAELIHLGVTLSSSPYGSVFYLTTGFHGLHVTGGLIAFLFVLGRTFMARRFTHEQAVTAIVVSYYWHFVDVVWIALFATIYLIQ